MLNDEKKSATKFWDNVFRETLKKGGYLSESVAKIKKSEYLSVLNLWVGNKPGIAVKTDCFEDAFYIDSCLKECLPGFSRIIVNDISLATVLAGRNNFPQDRFDWLCSDANGLPVKSESCDLVLSFGTQSYLDSATLGLKEAYRVLKPQGELIISVLNRNNPGFILAKMLNCKPLSLAAGYSRNSFMELLEKQGFVRIDSRFMLKIPPMLNNLFIYLEKYGCFSKSFLASFADKINNGLAKFNGLKYCFSWLIIFRAVKPEENKNHA